MADAFDPYHKWLGIPPHQQPANHYRLLAIELFEPDTEVVEQAADRQMQFVKGRCDGPHGEAARSLLNELAAARRCLLDGDRKKAYDEGLKAGQDVERKRAQNAPPPVLSPSESEDPGLVKQPIKPRAASEKKAAKTKTQSDQPVVVSKAGRRSSAQSTSPVVRSRNTQRESWIKIGIAVAAASFCIVSLPFFFGRKDDSAAKRARVESPQRQVDEVPQPAPETKPTSEQLVSAGNNEPDAAVNPATASEVAESPLPETNAVELAQAAAGESQPEVDAFPYEGLILWLDAADEERIEVDGVGRVAVWYDGSEAQNNAMQTSPAAQPKRILDRPRLPLVDFAGSQFLTVEDPNTFNLGEDYSFLFVARGKTGVMLDKGDGYNDGALSFWNGVSSFRSHNRTIKSGDEEADLLKVHAFVADAELGQWHIGGTLQKETRAAHTIENDHPLLLGRRVREDDPRFFVGQLAELLIYDRSLTSGQRRWVEDYLTGKWLAKEEPAALAVAGADKAKPGDGDAANREVARTASSLPAPRGAIRREIWNGVPGKEVADFVLHVSEHPEPDQRETIDKLETPEDFADNYGQRLRGYLHPPVNGEYEFAIRANAEGVLYLSTDEQAENKRLIELGAKIPLTAGQVYYLEAFHKESTGRDRFSIAWTFPDGTSENPIPGERLSIDPRLVPLHEKQFVALEPVSATASGGSDLRKLDDGRVLVAGKATTDERYELVFKTDIDRLTALRLEALPHEELPAGGPGGGIGGRFALGEVSVAARGIDGDAERQLVEFGQIRADDGTEVDRLADGNPKTTWRVNGRGQPAAVTLVPREAFELAGGMRLEVTLLNRENLGCFRLLVTSASEPIKATGDLAAAADGTLYSLHVNLGGDSHTAPDGVKWVKSQFFDNKTFGYEGGRAVAAEDIKNPVQGSAVRSIDAFRAVVPEGSYEVTLFFCEYWTTDASRRRFAIAVEQRVVARDLDLLRASGGFAMPFRYPIRNVTVKDGRLDIEFRPTTPSGAAILNAISIRQVR